MLIEFVISFFKSDTLDKSFYQLMVYYCLFNLLKGEINAWHQVVAKICQFPPAVAGQVDVIKNDLTDYEFRSHYKTTKLQTTQKMISLSSPEGVEIWPYFCQMCKHFMTHTKTCCGGIKNVLFFLHFN